MLALLAVSNWVYYTIFGVLGAIIALGLISWPIIYLIISRKVCLMIMHRGGKNDWSRGHASMKEYKQETMYETGMEWYRQNAQYKHEVHIVRDGLNLYGEYYDFGSDKCAMILSGRTETLEYGYYFAIPYAKQGYNILVVDPRAHGLSDGEFNTAGCEESKDALSWIRYIHDEFDVKSFFLHGICIGSAAAIYALTSDDCPDYIVGMAAEGMFANFSESMKEHLIEKKKPVFMFNSMVCAWMKHYTGHSMKVGPIDVIDKLNKPILMLHSKEDEYSKAPLAQKLYDKAQTTKQIVWFDHGNHSMLRLADTDKYDQAITDFLANNFS